MSNLIYHIVAKEVQELSFGYSVWPPQAGVKVRPYIRLGGEIEEGEVGATGFEPVASSV